MKAKYLLVLIVMISVLAKGNEGGKTSETPS